MAAAAAEAPRIEVVYALPDRQRVVEVVHREGMTALQAVEAAGMLAEFPALAEKGLELGVFGQRVDPARVLRAGDRVEIYRPLVADPRQQRRRLAAEAGGKTRR